MPQSLAKVYLHIVYSTKNRAALLQDAELRKRCHAYLAGACQNLECGALEVGGVADHVHALCTMSRTLSIAQLVRELKRESSKWLKTKGLHGFAWQAGYGAFSISPAHVPALRTYIAKQAEHHKSVSFQTEFLRLLKKYDTEYDERYVWE